MNYKLDPKMLEYWRKEHKNKTFYRCLDNFIFTRKNFKANTVEMVPFTVVSHPAFCAGTMKYKKNELTGVEYRFEMDNLIPIPESEVQ